MRGRPMQGLEEKTQEESHSVHLLMGMRARIVLVLIVRIEFDVIACRQKAACIQIGGAPLAVLALVEDFGTGVGRGMVVADCEAPFGRYPVAIAPSELAIGPIQIATVSIGNQYSSRHWNMKCEDGFQAIYRGLARRLDHAVSDC